jgi:hypothetical protein
VLLRSLHIKAEFKHVCEINLSIQFHQHFTSSFFDNILVPKNVTAKL